MFFSIDIFTSPRQWGLRGDLLLAKVEFMIIQVFSLGWKPIPSEARVTRDEVSGLPIIKGELSGRQYHTICSHAFGSLAMFKINHG